LAWLDQEIARTAADAPPSLSPTAESRLAPESRSSLAALPDDPAALASYRADSLAAAQRTQRGCVLAVSALLLAGALALIALYFLRYRDRSLFELTTEEPAAAPASPRK